MSGANVMHVMRGIDGGYLERVEIEPYGIIRCIGWCFKDIPECRIELNGKHIRPSSIYRRFRPDTGYGFSGFSVEFEIVSSADPSYIHFGDWCFEISPKNGRKPEYQTLLTGDTVLHRSDIYSVGAPSEEVHPEILALALTLEPPILDLGCGAGPFVRELRSRGIEAYGVELESERIRIGLIPSVVEFVTLYNGSFPLPFADLQFRSVLCTEVLEHIPDYEQALSEMARIANVAFITVPDMSSIPIGSYHHVVPWHLLEATHINFFNAKSLGKVVSRHFRSIRFFQLAPTSINGDFMPGCLGVLAN